MNQELAKHSVGRVIRILDCIFREIRDRGDASEQLTLSFMLMRLQEIDLGIDELQETAVWFYELTKERDPGLMKTENPHRIFDSYELEKFGVDGCDLLMRFTDYGVLDAGILEKVIHLLMILPQDHCSIDEVRWVVFTVIILEADDSAEWGERICKCIDIDG
jgi:uncharacterized protein Smg (DUF494 family)